MSETKLIAQQEHDGVRLDAFVATNVEGLTRSAAATLIDNQNIMVDGKNVSKSLKLKAGQEIVINMPPPVDSKASAQQIELDIVYEDDILVVVNKPKGMVVHPAAGNPDGTLVNALLYHCKGNLSAINGEIRPGIVHRIDKDTSGLLVIAKTNEAHLHLSKQLADHTMTREYHTIVYGTFKDHDGFVDKPIGRNPSDRKKMAITDKHSKTAYTSYKVIERYKGYTHLALRLKTGRTHQIRVHMASIGHPVVGDAVYGPKKVISSLNGQCLHAKTIGFIHPVSNEYMEFTSNLPEYFTHFLKGIQKEFVL